MSKKGTVLVVMHDEAKAAPLLSSLQQAGWDTTFASDATTALVSVRKQVPAAVVLEAGMPAGGTMIMLKRLRASLATAATPVIVTGTVTPAQWQAFMAEGARASMPDPVTGDALCTTLQQQFETPVVVTEAPAAVVHNPMRLAALQASGLLDTPPDASFDRVTRLVSRLLDAPTALFSLVDKNRQFFKSQTGLAEPWASQRQTPLSHSFCQWVISGREPVVISDARAHPVLRNNLAIQDLGVIAYTGVPINTTQGESLGSLCAIDGKPRTWTEKDVAILHDLARLAESCVAHATLVHQPPQRAEDFDHYAEATGAAIGAALGILRREGGSLDQNDKELLYDLIDEYGQHLVQLNRLIKVNQAIR